MYTIQNEGRRLQITGNLTGDVIYIPKSKASVWAVGDKVFIEYYYGEKNQPIDRQIWSGLYTEVSHPHTSSALIDKAADTGFTVHGDGGAGVLLEEGNGYDFDSGTGTITIDAANGGPTKLRIVIV